MRQYVTCVLALTLLGAGAARAQEPPAPVEATAPDAQAPAGEGRSRRVAGVLPSFLTTDLAPGTKPLTPREKFALSIRTSLDPSMYPLVGVMAGVTRSYGPGLAGYGKQYAASFADMITGNLLTSGALPAAFGQDPRYYRKGSGGGGRRAAYAVSRVFVAYGDNGRRRFNAAELLGTSAAAAFSNVYYPPDRLGTGDTLRRFGYQLMWDALANELQEFWPDISRRFRRRNQSRSGGGAGPE